MQINNVEYFIYRGLKIENFVTSNNELPVKNSTDSTELIEKIYEDEAKFNLLDIDFKASPEAFGWDYKNLPDSTLLTNIFYEKTSSSQLKVVTAGCVLGFFDQTNLNCGFEIILKDKSYLPTLKIARDIENVTEIASFSINDLPGNETLDKIRAREIILNYIDPAAFFMHCQPVGLTVKRSNNLSFTCTTYDQIFLEIVNKFSTANTIYIDIRNENGYSINYYKDNMGLSTDNDYGKHIQFSEDGITFNFLNYYTNYWPLLSVILSNNFTQAYSKIYLRFRKYYNPDPLVYLDVCQVIIKNSLTIPESNKKFISQPFDITLNPDWSETFEFAIPNNQNVSQLTHHVWYIKLYLIITQPSLNSVPSTSIRRNNFLDNVFGNLQTIYDKLNIVGTQWQTFTGKKYIEGQLEFGTSGMYEIKFGVSSSDVLFSAILLDPFIKTLKSFPSRQNLTLETTASGSSIDGEISSSIIDGIFANNTIEFNKIKFSTLNEEFFIHDLDSSDLENSEIHNNFTLLLSKSQFQSIIDEVENLNLDLADVMIQFIDYDYKTDLNLSEYQIANIQLAGLDIYGNVVQINSNLETKIYEGNRYNTSLTGSHLNLNITNKNPFTVLELVNLVKSVEDIYSNPQTLFLDNTPDKTVTRIRVHYYGYPGNGNLKARLSGIAFNKGVPSSPYLEKNPYSNAMYVASEKIPPSYYVLINRKALGLRIRNLYYNFYDEEGKIKFELNYHEYKRLTSNQNLKIGNDIIDIGHTFYGLDALLHTFNNSNPVDKPAQPFRNISTSKGFDIQHSMDFTNFIGDLASVLGNAYIDFKGNEHLITISTLDDYYDKIKSLKSVFLKDDQLGDIDIIGVKAAWDKVYTTNLQFKFSDVIMFYYGPITSYHNASLPENYTKRFTHFAKYYGLIDNAGIWYNDISPEMQAIKADWYLRVRKFAVFYYAAKPRFNNISNSVNITHALLMNNIEVDITNCFNGFQHLHINYLIEKYLNFIKNNL